jgi:hypothetical protein
MVKILDPMGSTEARGRIGGRVFNTWRGISYVKNNTAPAQPRSAKQLLLRSRAIALVRKWQTIGSIKQGWWNDFAATHTETGSMGVTKRLTGANWYVRLNTRLAELGTAPIDTPPAIPAPAGVTGFVLTPGALSFQFNWTQELTGVCKIEVWICGPHSPGRLGKIERAKLVSFWDAEAVGPEVIANLAPGTYTVFARLITEADGQVSPWVSSTVVVSAV